MQTSALRPQHCLLEEIPSDSLDHGCQRRPERITISADTEVPSLRLVARRSPTSSMSVKWQRVARSRRASLSPYPKVTETIVIRTPPGEIIRSLPISHVKMDNLHKIHRLRYGNLDYQLGHSRPLSSCSSTFKKCRFRGRAQRPRQRCSNLSAEAAPNGDGSETIEYDGVNCRGSAVWQKKQPGHVGPG